MGQYYHAVLTEDLELNKFQSYRGSGFKLMEVTWMKHPIWKPEPVLAKIDLELLEKPLRIAWVGDYSDYEDDLDNGDIKLMSPAFYNEIHRKTYDVVVKVGQEENYQFNYAKHSYLVNHTRKEFIRMIEYILLSEKINKERVLHPLPLLTATSNSKGGGDYHVEHESDKIGRWAFQEIQYSY